MAKRKQKERAATKPEKTVLYIVGESPLVEEFADLADEKGFAVFVRWNETDGNREASKKFRQSAAVPPKTSLALELTNIDAGEKKKNLQKLDKALPPTAAIVSSSTTVTASDQATWISNKHRLVGFGALPGFERASLVEVAPTVHSPKESVEVVARFFRALGKETEVVQDRVGLVFPRIVCQIVNEASFALQDDTASPADIDTAMKLGVNYPLGPVELADRIGFRHVVAVLSALYRDLQEDRYRTAPLLRQMAESGEWWKRS